MDSTHKSLAFVVLLAGVALAGLVGFVVLFVFAMSFDDASNNTDLKTWLGRIVLLAIPVLIAGADFIAWRAYQRGDYAITLRIGIGFAVLLIVGLYYVYQ